MRGQRATWEVKAARKKRTFWNERVSGVRGEKVGGKSQSGTRIVTLKRNEILLRQTRSHENTHTHNPHTHTNIHT